MKRSGQMGRVAAFRLLRLSLSGVFIYAGVAKLRDPHTFAESIESFRLLPPVLTTLAALTLPPLEIFSGILALTVGRPRRVGAFSLLAMLALFLVALMQAQVRGLAVDCGCFGADKFDVLSPTKNLWIAITRDAVLGAIAWTLYATSQDKETPGRLSRLRID